MSERLIGSAVTRKEDYRLLTGQGLYVGDLREPGMLHAAVLRSPYAHARIRRIELAAARAMPGVKLVLSQAELPPHVTPIPLYSTYPGLQGASPYPLAREKVRFVGEPVVFVVAEDRYIAEDALDLIEVDYEPLPAVVDPLSALEPGSALVHEALGSNLALQFTQATGDVDAAFTRAAHVAQVRLKVGRCAGQPMEARGILASPGAGRSEQLTIWDSTQSVHLVQRIVSRMLKLPEASVRVIAPDVGGGFGTKNRFYPEEFLVPFAALALRRPVRWLADRREDLISTYQERAQEQEGEIALDKDGTILGVRAHICQDQGAYTPFGVVVPRNSATGTPGPYRVPNYRCDVDVVYTNKPAVAPYRGAGFAQGSFLIERLLDRAAAVMGIDPADLRRRNLITGAEQPYDTGLKAHDGRAIQYDGGDYRSALDAVLERVDVTCFRAEQERLRQQGRYIGLGLGCYVELTGIGLYEAATVRVDGSGTVSVYSSVTSQGQGQETTLAQVCAERLGVPFDSVRVVLGDTLGQPYGMGTSASRSAIAAGNAVSAAAREVRAKALQRAAQILECDPADLDLADGWVAVRSAPDRGCALAALAQSVSHPNLGGLKLSPNALFELPGHPGLEASAVFRPPLGFSYGAHAAMVEVDPVGGAVKVQKYIVLHDCGKRLNPAIVDGQTYGAVAQGIGSALFEEVLHDEAGQPQNASYMDYLLPTASEVPAVEILHRESPGENPEGLKGAGEGDIIPVAGVLCGAVDDALAHLGVFADAVPITPVRVQQWADGRRPGHMGSAGVDQREGLLMNCSIEGVGPAGGMRR